MTAFSSVLCGADEYRAIALDIKKHRLPAGVLGLSPTPKAHLISALCGENSKRALVLVPDEGIGHRLAADIIALGARALVYPARDFSFRYSESRSREFEHKRIGVLGKISDGDYDVIVSTATAAAQMTIPLGELKKYSISLKIMQESRVEKIISCLLASGYSRCELVDGSGQFAVRGGILDFFPPDSAEPVRVEFWGDRVDAIGHFDILTQRRTDTLDEIKITPSSEIIFESDTAFREKIESFALGVKGKGSVKVREGLNSDAEMLANGIRPASMDKYLNLAYPSAETLFDYCSEDMLFVCESSAVKERAVAADELFAEDIKMLFEDGCLCRGLDTFTVHFSRVLALYEKMGAVYLDNFARGSFDTPVKDLITFNVQNLSPWEGSLSVLMDDIKPAVNRGVTPVIFAGNDKTAEALAEDLISEGIKSVYYPVIPQKFLDGYVNILNGGLSSGMEYPRLKYMFITYGRGRIVSSKGSKAHKAQFKANEGFHSIEELHRGDYVVHSVHGIGVFDGITKMNAGGFVKDYIKIKYAASDVLYVPVTQLDLVSKYIGPHTDDGKAVKINRLGSKDWEKAKTRVRSAVKEMAGELIALYSKRLNSPGYQFSPDIDMQSDFERRFEFDETDDQLRSISEIKHDMEQPFPMDRLLCGDVGFGKTEVALRAAFKCIADGKQCAILVPTTILALQHYQTILRRFEGFPVNAEMISRFRTPKQQDKILTELRRGSLDIIVGTHRLISKDVKFKDIGLLIVDEEQRFGVAQKEKIKELFPNVDVLTLSATPIPRTLNMAMTGIRDMSVLEEAPNDRLPVQSYVIEHDMGIIAEAISKELRRGGQVYYLYNRVETIADAAAQIQKHVPDARIGVAHGKMSESEISSVWKQLLENEIDVLVCTTIIETGVDVPNVNTLIIENADRLGLAQLHQIRGRVGRSSRRASAYFTFVKGKQLTEIAERRLSAIREFTEFGSGFKIAMRDLEIRGAGNILGAQQHGHMESVGYDMYIKLLSEAVAIAAAEQGDTENADSKEKLKARLMEKDCLIDIQFEAHIPDSYIESIPQRLGIYRRIADVKTRDDADDVMDELIDRFGEPPTSVKGLITVSLLRNTASKFGVYEIGQRGESMLLYVNEINMQYVQLLAATMRGRVMVSASEKPYITVKAGHAQSSLGCLTEVFDILLADCEKNEKPENITK